jgi:acyl-coenzyme A thioesterase PaaI-like protein
VSQPRPYPPEHHVLRDLGLELETTPDGTARAAGVLATMVDAVCGNLAVFAVAPDRVATADLALTVLRPADGPQIEATGRVIRRGRTTVVVEVELSGVAWATATFAVLAHRAETPGPVVGTPPRGRRALLGGSGRPLDRWIGDEIGLAVTDAAAGALTIHLSDYVTNSFGALQGGMVAFVAEQAGATAVGAALGAPATTVDLHIAYLSQCRGGPFRTTATVLAAEDGAGWATVHIVDEGAEDRLTTVAHVTAIAGGAP